MLSSPHRSIAAADPRESFALELLDRLWVRYRERVPYVQVYERLLAESGGNFVNDHLAFRTLACSDPATGLFAVSRVFEALGYVASACYQFPEKHLSSIHYQHPNPDFPKLFISELKTWELSPPARSAITRSLRGHRALLSEEFLSSLRAPNFQPLGRVKLLSELEHFFCELPWEAPQKSDLILADKESQFGSWVLVHGYMVNHFTASVNAQGAPALSDIEKTVAALRRAGVPMKAEIEGAPASKLRQSATEAVLADVSVREGKKALRIPWTYAYFELAERGEAVDPETGHVSRFEGFLGGQATELFEMTRRKPENK